MAEIIEDIKTSILEVTTNQGIILTSDNTQILHTGTGTTGTFTIESYRAISIDSNDTTNGINIGTNNSVPVNIGHTGNNINILGGLISTIQEINNTGTTAISLTTLTTTFSTPSASFSSSLANGTSGQIKILATSNISAGRTVTVTPTSAIGYTSFSFNESGDSATLLYTSSGWIVINERNVSFN